MECEICDKETEKLSECRQCKTKVCSNCMIGRKCVDCVRDEEDDSGRPPKFYKDL